jgi:hypothetical protein
MNVIDSGLNTLDDRAEHVGLSYLRARVRTVGNHKLIVDVWEYTEHRTSKARALRFARDSVQVFGITSADHTKLLDHEIERKVSDSSGVQSVIRVRQSTFAFQGVS